MIAIVDYGAGNLFSVTNALEHLSISYQITQEPQALYESDGVLLPGVGAFPDAMAMLREKDLIPILRQMAKKKPFLGICPGYAGAVLPGGRILPDKRAGSFKGTGEKNEPAGTENPPHGLEPAGNRAGLSADTWAAGTGICLFCPFLSGSAAGKRSGRLG